MTSRMRQYTTERRILRHPLVTCATCCLVTVVLLLRVASAQDTVVDDYWPQWRGPLATGVAPHGNPPTEWDESTGKNIRWKVPIPGKGHSTPVIWDNLIFLTTAIPVGEALPPRYSGAPGADDNAPITHQQEFVALAISRPDGQIAWQRTLRTNLPHEGAHFSGSLASASPATDGKLVFFHFGSQGLYGLDYEGSTRWQADLGLMNTKHGHGEGSSPALYQDILVVNWDHEGQSYVVAFDAETGQRRWKQPREEVTSWSSPLIVEHNRRAQVIVAGTGRVRAYDLETGDVIWECGGLSHNIVATPVAGDGLVFVGSSYEKKAMFAIRLEGARGDITGSDNVVWSRANGRRTSPRHCSTATRSTFCVTIRGF